MHAARPTGLALRTAAALAGSLAVGCATAQTITVDASTRHQTMTGWEAVDFAIHLPGPPGSGDWSPAFDRFIGPLTEMATHDLGINRVRLEMRSGIENAQDWFAQYTSGQLPLSSNAAPWGWRQLRYSTVNDNGDPFVLNPSGFQFSELDNTVTKVIAPLRERLQQLGERLYVNLCYVAFTKQIPSGSGLAFVHDDPEEYAELMLATFLHLRGRYGWVPDAIELCLEPDNVPQLEGTWLGRAAVAVAARLRANGFAVPELVLPSVTDMSHAASYFDAAAAVPGALAYFSELSYHRYGGANAQNLGNIVSRARQSGLRTSMLEWWAPQNGVETLHQDLRDGDNAAWQQGPLAARGRSGWMQLYSIDDQDPANPVISLHPTTELMRQYYKYVRAGAVRIGASSSTSSLDPLAFVNRSGDFAVVVKADRGVSFGVDGLPAGTYGITYTTTDEYDRDLPDATITTGATLPARIPAAGVVTIHRQTAPPNPGAIRFSAAHFNYRFGEGAGDVAIVVRRVGGKSGTVRVRYFTQGGTATPGRDYHSASGWLTFGPGVTRQAFGIRLIDDSDPEPDETVLLYLAAENAPLIGPVPSTLIIDDNDHSSVRTATKK